MELRAVCLMSNPLHILCVLIKIMDTVPGYDIFHPMKIILKNISKNIIKY